MTQTPFIYGKVASRPDFTDRQEEVQLLKRNFKSQMNTILVSPRRWGKTSLVKRATEEVTKESKTIKICNLDIFDLRSESEFYTALAGKVLESTSSKLEELTKNAGDLLSRFIPQITLSPDMQTELTFGLNFEEIKRKPDEILDLAENIAQRKKLRILICIDEFQNIASFGDPEGFQKKLRSHWQRHQKVTYCLYGSKRNMLLDIFSNPSMPFYKFGDLILLEKIKTADWVTFIQKRFTDTGKKIGKASATLIAQLADNHPYYVQQLAQQSWFRTDKKCREEIVYEAHESLINQLSLLFSNTTETLSAAQISLLRAILSEEKQLTSRAVLDKYRLNSSAHVVSIKKRLIEMELIDEESGKLVFLDPMYEYWLRRKL